ncbi:MAG: hypothetical protein U1C19_03525 [Methanobacteriaceae archaeon]|nr:hypothetical protein [Methanobacteriaceae archaeon]
MSYNILIPSLTFLIAYLSTYSLYKLGLIKKGLHINLWNIILLASFIISGGAGFILMILMEMGIVSTINFGLLYWHVELGITMTLVTVFHFHIYWKSTKKTLFGHKKKRRMDS